MHKSLHLSNPVVLTLIFSKLFMSFMKMVHLSTCCFHIQEQILAWNRQPSNPSPAIAAYRLAEPKGETHRWIRASGLDDSKEVLERLLGLFLDATLDQLEFGGEGDAARDIGDAVVHDSLRVRSDGTRRLGGVDDLVRSRHGCSRCRAGKGADSESAGQRSNVVAAQHDGLQARCSEESRWCTDHLCVLYAPNVHPAAKI